MVVCKLAGLSVIASLCFTVAPQWGQAAIVQYDRTTWEGLTAIQDGTGFEGIAPAGGAVDYDTNTDLVLSGMTFHGFYNNGSGIAFASDGMSVVDPGVSYGGELVYDWNSGAVLFGLADYAQTGAGGSIKVILPDGVNAVAFDTMGYLTDTSLNWTGYGMSVLAQFYKGDNTVDNLLGGVVIPAGQRPDRAQLGFVSTTDDIKTIVLAPESPDTSTYAFPLYDSFAYGVASVPEPTTLLVIPGLASLVLLRRRPA
jgi:hypothetical protein